MSVSLAELQILTLRKVDEAYDSSSAEVADGTGGILSVDSSWAQGSGTSLTTMNTITDYLNEVQNIWCQTAWMLEGTASRTWALNTEKYNLSDFTPASSQGALWAVESLVLNTSTLIQTTKSDLQREVRDFRTAAAGTSEYWYTEQEVVHLYPKTDTAYTCTLYGYALPPMLGSGSSGTVTSASFMRDDLIRKVLPLGAGILLVKRKATDPSLIGRLPDLTAEFQEVFLRERSRLSESVRRVFYTDLPSDLRGR